MNLINLWRKSGWNLLMAVHWKTKYRYPSVDSHQVGYRDMTYIRRLTVSVWNKNDGYYDGLLKPVIRSKN